MISNGFGSSRLPATTYCRWTIAARNGSTPILAGRPLLVRGTSQVLANGMGGLNENGLINVKNKSHSITAQVIVPEGEPAQGLFCRKAGLAAVGCSMSRTES